MSKEREKKAKVTTTSILVEELAVLPGKLGLVPHTEAHSDDDTFNRIEQHIRIYKFSSGHATKIHKIQLNRQRDENIVQELTRTNK